MFITGMVGGGMCERLVVVRGIAWLDSACRVASACVERLCDICLGQGGWPRSDRAVAGAQTACISCITGLLHTYLLGGAQRTTQWTEKCAGRAGAGATVSWWCLTIHDRRFHVSTLAHSLAVDGRPWSVRNATAALPRMWYQLSEQRTEHVLRTRVDNARGSHNTLIQYTKQYRTTTRQHAAPPSTAVTSTTEYFTQYTFTTRHSTCPHLSVLAAFIYGY